MIKYCVCCDTGNSELDKMVSDLSMGLSVMKHEQEYMEVRERLHRMSECFTSTLESS